MVVDGGSVFSIFSSQFLFIVLETGLTTLAFLYFIFSLIVVRQVSLMTEILITEVSPWLRAFSILHAGLSLGVVVLMLGTILG